MKVKITKCSHDKAWYKDQIGKTFTVEGEREYGPLGKAYWVDRGRGLTEFSRKKGAILVGDCKVIKEKKTSSEVSQ